jgi:hypothetical protein
LTQQEQHNKLKAIANREETRELRDKRDENRREPRRFWPIVVRRGGENEAKVKNLEVTKLRRAQKNGKERSKFGRKGQRRGKSERQVVDTG